jgi:hypothetical protein
MIISASRRTDIPTYYAEWFRNRLGAGFCTTRNPFRPSQVRRVSLAREDVDAFVFWTRDARPFLPVLEELERRGFPSVFLVTLTGYPAPLEPAQPGRGELLAAFRALSLRVGPERVVWRYDPILLSSATPPSFHRENFSSLASALEGLTRRVVVSVADFYAKTVRRLDALRPLGFDYDRDPWSRGALGELLSFVGEEARARGMEAVTCCEPAAERFGLPAGSCVDAGYLNRLFGLSLSGRKDPGQRPDCWCAVSVDIGAADTCPRGCVVCYATNSFDRARMRCEGFDPTSEGLAPAPPVGPPIRNR